MTSRVSHRYDIPFCVMSVESRDYNPRDIFNTDERRLFYRTLPKKSRVFKDDSYDNSLSTKEFISREQYLLADKIDFYFMSNFIKS